MTNDASRFSHFDARPSISPARPGSPHQLTGSPHQLTGSPVTLPLPSGLTVPATTGAPMELHTADATIAFPPVRQPSLQLRRYTRRIGGPARPKFTVNVSPKAFHLWWFLVLVIHMVCAVFLGFVGAMYFYLLGTALLGYLTLYGVAVDAFYFPPIGLAYFIACGLHAFSVATIGFHSLWSQRSVFTSTQFSARTVTTPTIRIRRMSHTALSSIEFRTQSVLGRLPSPFVRSCFRVWHGCSKVYKASDLKNECYDSVYVTRQILQTLCHVHQLYLASLLLPDRRISTIWVCLVVANCWCTPLVMALVQSAKRPQARLACVVLNLVVDVVALVVIPVVLYFPYRAQFDGETTNFPSTKWYNDRWFMHTINEFQLLLVCSWIDCVTKIGIALNVSRGLRIIPTLLCKGELDEVAVVPEKPVDALNSVSGIPTGVVARHQPVSNENSVAVTPSGRFSIANIGKLLLLLIGSAVLAVHLHAARQTTISSDCAVPIWPWFATKPACSFLEYKCVDANQTGSEEDLDLFLRSYDEALVSYLSIRYCSRVTMPSRIATLNHLIGLKMYNSSIATWTQQTAMTDTSHPRLRFVFLIDVSMAELPQGLQSSDFPRHLYDVEICRTNLTSLPETLDTNWPTKMSLILEEIPFTAFPPVLTRLQPSSLSLSKSQLTAVPPELFTNELLYFVLLNGNPLTELPANVTLGGRLYWISLQSTLISSVPDAYGAISIDAGGTPYCNDALAARTTTGSTDCTTVAKPSELTLYPLELEELLNGSKPPPSQQE